MRAGGDGDGNRHREIEIKLEGETERWGREDNGGGGDRMGTGASRFWALLKISLRACISNTASSYSF